MSRPAFTLIELTVVILVMAVLAAATAFSLRGDLARVRLNFAADRLASLDQATRSEAVRQAAPRLLRFNLRTHAVEQWRPGERRPFRVVRLPRGVQFDAQQLPGRSSSSLRVRVSELGQSDSYRIKLSTASRHSLSLFISGLSGQILKGNRERHSFPAAHSTPRPDAR